MLLTYFGRVVQIGDRSGYAQDLVMSAGRQTWFVRARLEQVPARAVQLAHLPHLSAGHLAIGPLRRLAEPPFLPGPRGVDLLPHSSAVGSPRPCQQLLERNRRHLDVD